MGVGNAVSAHEERRCCTKRPWNGSRLNPGGIRQPAAVAATDLTDDWTGGRRSVSTASNDSAHTTSARDRSRRDGSRTVKESTIRWPTAAD